MFQSTPVIADGRTASDANLLLEHFGFNPRPSLLTDEPCQPGEPINLKTFQSTPVIADGRTGAVTVTTGDKEVSIHARHC